MLFILAQDEEMFGKKLTKEKREINKDMKYSNKQRERQKMLFCQPEKKSFPT